MPITESREENVEHDSYACNEIIARIIVRDVAHEQTKTYSCRAHVLQMYMQFFTPYIAQQVQKHVNESNGEDVNANACVKLQVSCDLEIFNLVWEWMLADLANRQGDVRAPLSSTNTSSTVYSSQHSLEHALFTVENVVSIALCANFLHIDQLLEQALLYFREHVSEICLSHVNLSCIPGDLLGRISGYVKPAHLATTLQKMYETNAAHHPNRSFLTSLLRHILLEEITHASTQSRLLTISKTSDCGVSSTTQKENEEPEHLPESKSEDEREEKEESIQKLTVMRDSENFDRKSAYQWCSLCGVLFNQSTISLLTHQFMWAPPCCSALPSLYTDDKGEKLITHCTLAVHEDKGKRRDGTADALRWLKQCLCTNPSAKNEPANKTYGKHFTTKSEVKEEAEKTHKRVNMAMELFCWKLYGTITYVVCISCNHLLPLIDTSNHFLQCAYDIHEVNAAVHECFLWPDGKIVQSVERQKELSALLEWYDFAEREGVYEAFANSLEPLRRFCGDAKCDESTNGINDKDSETFHEQQRKQQEQQQQLEEQKVSSPHQEYKGKENEYICSQWSNSLKRYAEMKKKVAKCSEHLLPNAKTALTYNWSKQTNSVLSHVLPIPSDVSSSDRDYHEEKERQKQKYNEERQCNMIDQIMYYERNMQMTLTKEMSKARHFTNVCQSENEVDTHNNCKQLCSLKDHTISLVPSLPYAEARHKSRKTRLNRTNHVRSSYTSSSASKAVLSLAHRHRLNTQ